MRTTQDVINILVRTMLRPERYRYALVQILRAIKAIDAEHAEDRYGLLCDAIHDAVGEVLPE
jgi:hypothetical protein